MKNSIAILFLIIALLIGCNERSGQPGEPCSVQLPEIHFTRSLNDAVNNASAENKEITIHSDAKKDYFNDPDGKLSNGTAPVLLAEVDNTKSFTLTAKVTPLFKTTYDAGALYIFSTETLWHKFAFEQDERGKTRIVTVRTIDTSDDNNHEAITQDHVYLKISSDTKTVGFYFSTDNVTWNLARLYKNNYPKVIWLGISSQSPIGSGNSTMFENCSLTDKSVKDFRTGL